MLSISGQVGGAGTSEIEGQGSSPEGKMQRGDPGRRRGDYAQNPRWEGDREVLEREREREREKKCFFSQAERETRK